MFESSYQTKAIMRNPGPTALLGHDPIAVIGYSITLPRDIVSGEKFFELIRQKTQLTKAIDVVEAGRYEESMMDVNDTKNPWRLRGRHATFFTDEEAESFDAAFFNLPAKMLKTLQPIQVAILQSVWEALEDAGLPASNIHRTNTGVFCAAYSNFGAAAEAPDETFMRSNLMSSISDSVSYFLGTTGPSVNLETACSTSLVGIAAAMASIRSGDCQMAIVAAGNRLCDKDFQLGLQACGVLNQSPCCHPFDHEGPKGYIRAEGYGTLILKRLSDAERDGNRVLCVLANAVAGAAGPQEGLMEGSGRVYEQPNAYGIRRLMHHAYESCGISLDAVSYLECHATGTQVGDLIELEAIGSLFADSHQARPLRVASVKSNIGHAEVAAGMFSTIKCIEMLRRRVFLPTAGVATPRKDFDWEKNNIHIMQEEEAFPPISEGPVVIGVNSFGIGGSYGHVVLVEHTKSAERFIPLPPASSPTLTSYLVPLATFGKQHMVAFTRELATYLRALSTEGRNTLSVRDVACTLALHRSRFNTRKAIVASTVDELIEKLEAIAQSGSSVAAGEAKRLKVAMIFTGQGSQWAGCGKSLMERFPVYRRAAVRVDSEFRKLAGWSILDKLDILSNEELSHVQFAQPATFLIQIALVELLSYYGISCHAVIGHSAGEVAAAYTAGLLNLAQAVKVCYVRSVEQQRLVGSGRMLAVAMGEEDIRQLIRPYHTVEVACINSPTSCVLAGPQHALDDIKLRLAEHVKSVLIPGSIAFHSSRTDPILNNISRRLSSLKYHRRWSIPFISTVTGQLETELRGDYWSQNVRRPVMFKKAVELLLSGRHFEPPDCVIEVGPHKTLIPPFLETAQSISTTSPPAAMCTLKKNALCVAQVFEAVGALYEKGVDVDLKALYNEPFNFTEDLPKHPFIRKRLNENYFVVRDEYHRTGTYQQGPYCGAKRGPRVVEVEVSDRTFGQMLGHAIGGKSIVPGAFWTELAIEAFGGCRISLVDVEFKNMLAVPSTKAGQFPAIVRLTADSEDERGLAFNITSLPSREKRGEKPIVVEHCTGRAIRGALHLDENGAITKGLVPGDHGLMVRLEGLCDIGADALLRLEHGHCELLAQTKEKFYGTICIEGLIDYKDSFQCIQWVRRDPFTGTMFARLEFDQEAVDKEGGFYSMEMLDSVTQVAYLGPLALANAAFYAGGFEAAHFFRKCGSNVAYVHFKPEKNTFFVGRKLIGGDFSVYDEDGRLCLYIYHSWGILGEVLNNFQLVGPHWDPYIAGAVLPATLEALPSCISLEEGRWTEEDDTALTLWLLQRLEPLDGSIPDAKPLLSLLEQAKEEYPVPGDGRISHWPSEQLAKSSEHLIRAIKSKLRGEESAGHTEEKGEGGKEAVELVPLEAKHLPALYARGTRQVEEAVVIAHALIEMVQQQDKSVYRILEVIGANPGHSSTVLEMMQTSNWSEGGPIIEYFLACHDARSLRWAAQAGPSKLAKNFRIRLVLITDVKASYMEDWAFDTLIVGDWLGSTYKAWECGEGDHYTPAQQLVQVLGPLLLPSGRVFVRGISAIPLWVSIIGEAIGVHIPSRVAVENGLNEWEEVLSSTPYMGVGSVTLPGTVIITAQRSANLLVSHRGSLQTDIPEMRYVIIAHKKEDGERLASSLLYEKQHGLEVSLLVIEPGGPLDDDVDQNVWAQELKSRLQTKDDHQASDNRGDEASQENLKQEPQRVVIFVPGLGAQEDPLASLTICRLTKLAKALYANTVSLPEMKPRLWVTTQGVTQGQIHPSQGSIWGFLVGLGTETRQVIDTRIVDLEDATALVHLPKLLLSGDMKEKVVGLSTTGDIRVRRYGVTSRDRIRQMTLRPDGPISYYCDVSDNLETIPGRVNINFRAIQLASPREGEVMVDVCCTALNFRDVMVAMSLLPVKSYERSFYGRNLGLESTGIVCAVGPGVKNMYVGDRVIFGSPRSFANRMVLPADRVGVLSSNISLEDAAALQSVYSTAQYSLVTCARVKRGERVLIHGGAGGVGHAAISISRFYGAEIYITAGSEEKRALCRALGAQHTYDSRSTSWFDGVMRDTKDEGVDIVLNCLSGKHQRLGLQALRSGGRFVEIGKMDIFENNKLDLVPFRKNISFFAVDMDRLALEDAEAFKALGKTVLDRIEKSDYSLIPVSIYPMNKLREAMEVMRTGKHVGKLVICNYIKDDKDAGEGITDPSCATYKPVSATVERPQIMFRADATYLITGGAGGFGSRLVRFAHVRGARHFIITTRSSDHTATKAKFQDLLAAGVKILVVTADVASREDVHRLVEMAAKASPPVRAIFHAAGVSIDKPIPELDFQDYAKVSAPKALGAWYLHDLSQKQGLDLEAFVCISSLASHIGGTGVAYYCAANAFLDTLVRYRRSQGLPGLSYNMASLSDVGILADNLKARQIQIKSGVEFMSSFQACRELELCLMAGLEEGVSMFFGSTAKSFFPSCSQWSHLLEKDFEVGGGGSGAASTFTSAMDVAAYLVEAIRGMTGAEEIFVTQQLVNLGLDSFGLVELGSRVRKEFDVDLNPSQLRADSTIEDVAQLIFKMMLRGRGTSATGGDRVSAQEITGEAAVALNLGSVFGRKELNEMMHTSYAGEKNDKSKTPVPPSLPSLRPRAGVLLLGATGLNGAHVLRYLIKSGTPKVYCLVRAYSPSGGYNRIRATLQRLKIWKASFATHIVAVCGDISKPNLGVGDADYSMIARSVSEVFQAACPRYWIVTPDAHACYVTGTMHTVAFARRARLAIHGLSTNWLDMRSEFTYETGKLHYIQLRRAMEDILQLASQRYEVRCHIYRHPDTIMNTRLALQNSSLIFQVARAFASTSMFPAAFQEASLPIMCADVAMKTIVRMSRVPSLPRLRTARGPMEATIHTLTPMCTFLPCHELARMVEEVGGVRLNRQASMQGFIDSFLEKTKDQQVVDVVVKLTEVQLEPMGHKAMALWSFMRRILRTGDRSRETLALVWEWVRCHRDEVSPWKGEDEQEQQKEGGGREREGARREADEDEDESGKHEEKEASSGSESDGETHTSNTVMSTTTSSNGKSLNNNNHHNSSGGLSAAAPVPTPSQSMRAIEIAQ